MNIQKKTKQTMKKRTTILLLTIILTTTTTINAQTNPQSIIINQYPDGTTHIQITTTTDPTKPRNNITLIGKTTQNTIITDENNLPLNWKTTPTGITINTLGSKTATITYETYSLTNKTANQWTLTITTPINTIINLPENAILTGLEPTPISITTTQKQITLTQPNGTNRISYILGTTGTKERAIILLNNAENQVNQAKTAGVIVEQSEAMCNQAKQAFNEKDYARSEQHSINTIEQIQETILNAQAAQEAIQSALLLIEQTQNNIDPDSLNQDNLKLELAQTNYNEGRYQEAKKLADEAYEHTASATKAQKPFPVSIIVGATVVGIILFWSGVKLVSNNRKTPGRPVPSETSEDLESLFKNNSNLRTDEKAVLMYIHELQGVFVTEIRERFNMPKSTAWRMIKRLDEQALISTETVGRETYVTIKQ